MRNSRMSLAILPCYEHVDVYMDNTLLWYQLLLEQQINCICDFCVNNCNNSPQLPRKGVTGIVNWVKLTSDIAQAVSYQAGKHQIRYFMVNEKGWMQE